MNKNQNIGELVSRYLEGEMTDLEKTNFENQLANNSSIQEEYQFQNDIIEGIKENRRAELKARLDQINIPSSNVYQYIGVKVAALITITTMIGFGAYYTIFDNSESNTSSQISITQQNSNEIELVVPEMPETVVEEEMDIEEIVVEKEIKKDKTKKDKDNKDKSKTDDPVTASSELPTPKIVKPDAVEFIADDKIDHKDDSFEIGNNNLNNIKDVMENKVEVETISDKKKNLHYQFYNKKLFLYGDFDKTPYEILEYNAGGSKLYYLYYEGKYYGLDSNQMKTVPLEEINDNELLNELEQLRK